MSDKELGMYDTDDFVVDKTDTDVNVSVNKMPVVTELKIADKTISIVNPEYVNSLHRKLTYLENRVRTLETELKTVRGGMRSLAESSTKRYDTNDYDR
jgi:hypothetical protein